MSDKWEKLNQEFDGLLNRLTKENWENWYNNLKRNKMKLEIRKLRKKWNWDIVQGNDEYFVKFIAYSPFQAEVYDEIQRRVNIHEELIALLKVYVESDEIDGDYARKGRELISRAKDKTI
jgi:predicted transcriptional regulator